MKLRKSILACILCGISASSIATTQVVSQSRVNLFLDSASPFVANDWTVGSTNGTAIGDVKILKSTGNSSYGLLMEKTISKHFLPWTGSGRNAAGNYNIVDIK